MKKILSFLFGPLVVAVLCLSGVHEADAHATPVAYEPENSAIVEKTPGIIKIHYSERVDLNASSIEVFGPDGTRIDNKDASVPPDNPRLFQVNIPDRGEGTYTVSWKVLSADDGHFSNGAFIFSVGKETGAGVASTNQLQVVYRSN
jgi:copper transport protein